MLTSVERFTAVSAAACLEQPLLGAIDHLAMGIRCHAAYGLRAFTNGERLRIGVCAPGEEGAGSPIRLPSLASFQGPMDSAPVFRAIFDAYPNFRVCHTCYADTLIATGGLDVVMEWDTPLWDQAAT